MPNAVSEFLRGEIAQVNWAKRLGMDRQIAQTDVLLTYKRAADELDTLRSLLEEMRNAACSIPEMQNKERFSDLGARVNKALD